MNDADLKMLAKGMAPVLREMFDQRDARSNALEARLNRLEAAAGQTSGGSPDIEKRLSDLEQRSASLAYAGVWQPREYAKDEAVTHSGSLWVARRNTKPIERPGDDSAAFQLAVKAGRDGKDLR